MDSLLPRPFVVLYIAAVLVVIGVYTRHLQRRAAVEQQQPAPSAAHRQPGPPVEAPAFEPDLPSCVAAMRAPWHSSWRYIELPCIPVNDMDTYLALLFAASVVDTANLMATPRTPPEVSRHYINIWDVGVNHTRTLLGLDFVRMSYPFVSQ